jgi:hypothetical protein
LHGKLFLSFKNSSPLSFRQLLPSSLLFLFILLLFSLLPSSFLYPTRQREKESETERVAEREREAEMRDREREREREKQRWETERETTIERERERGPIVMDPDRTGEERIGGGRSSMGRRRTRLPTAWSGTSGGWAGSASSSRAVAISGDSRSGFRRARDRVCVKPGRPIKPVQPETNRGRKSLLSATASSHRSLSPFLSQSVYTQNRATAPSFLKLQKNPQSKIKPFALSLTP